MYRALLLALVGLTVQTHALVLPAGTTALSRVGTIGASQQLCSVRSAPTRHLDVVMAVPKKRQSKMKTRQRKANWFAKARRQAQLALNRAKSVKYDPFEDPKYALDGGDDEDDDDEDDEDAPAPAPAPAPAAN